MGTTERSPTKITAQGGLALAHEGGWRRCYDASAVGNNPASTASALQSLY